jgi:hypothetical protein
MNVPARRANGQLIGGQGSLNPSGRPRNAIEELRAKYMHRLPELFDGLFQLPGRKLIIITSIKEAIAFGRKRADQIAARSSRPKQKLVSSRSKPKHLRSA